MDDLLCFGFGVLKLVPHELYRLTPGELLDMAIAHLWTQRQSRPAGPMDAATRAMENAKLDQILSRRG